MIDHSTLCKNRWWQRINNTRRRYFFQHLRNSKQASGVSFKKLTRWIRDDIVYTTTWGLNIFLQLRAYGAIIKKNHGLSLWQQFTRMAYLAFVLQVDPGHLRGRQLYRLESWKHVDDYTYSHHLSQYHLAELSFPEEVELFEDKFKFFKFCKSHNFHSPNILGVFNNGKIDYPADSPVILPDENIFIKDLNGKAGQGTKKLTYSDGLFRDRENNEFSPDDIMNFLLDYSKNSSVILQNSLVNHSSWQPFTSGALATCRIVTARTPDDNPIIPLICAIRMPVGKADIDNFSKGGFYSAIDPETGILGSTAGLKPVNGAFEFLHHPDTGQKIQGTKLPFWKDVLEFTLEVHSKFRTIFVGWDVCMTAQGCCVVEGNIGWASRSYECPQMKPLRETIYPELYEKWMERYSAST